MVFWSDATGRDPKRQYRWIMEISSIPAYVLKKVTKPSFVVEESTHKYLNHTYYYPGRVTWNTIEVTLADPVDPDIANTVANIISNGGYKPATDPNMHGTMSKKKAVESLGNLITIKQIDADGAAVETWRLVNPWIKDVKFGDLDYEGDEMTEITLELRYDWAELQTANDGVPQVDGDKKVWGA
jgi:hypothetical protein